MTTYEIKSGLKTNILGKEIVYFDETTSTNDIAFALAIDGALDGTLVIADSQTKGKGRLDRKWFSPKGTSILASLILRPNIPLSHISNIVLITTISVVQAIRHITDLAAMIKWPNDVVINGRKVSGILVESKIEKNRAEFFVVGFGINVNTSQNDFPDEIFETATSLSIESKREISRIQLLREALYQLELRYTKLLDESADFLQEWKDLSLIIGRRISVEKPDGIFSAQALDIDKNGALVIQLDSGEIQSIMNDDLIKIKC